MNGIFKDWPTTQAKNVQRLRDAEKKGRLDFVLYGDSISSFHYGYTVSSKNPGSDVVWKKYFGSLNAVPLAIPGDQIGQVIWRLQKGNEQPKEDPRVVGFLIGINDCIRFGEDKTQPRVPPTTERMKQLLEWVRKNMPTSAVLVCGLTPITNTERLADRAALNTAYKSLAESFRRKGMRISYVECGASISNADGTPKSATYLSDTVHLTSKGHDAVLKAMRTAVDNLRGGSESPVTTVPKTRRPILLAAAASIVVFSCMCLMSGLLLVSMR